MMRVKKDKEFEVTKIYIFFEFLTYVTQTEFTIYSVHIFHSIYILQFSMARKNVEIVME